MKIGIGGGFGPVRGGVSNRGFGIGIGPVSAGGRYPGRRKHPGGTSPGASGGGAGAAAIVGGICVALVIFLITLPYRFGTSIAVALFGADNPSAARTVTGWTVQVACVAALIALMWKSHKSGREGSSSSASSASVSLTAAPMPAWRQADVELQRFGRAVTDALDRLPDAAAWHTARVRVGYDGRSLNLVGWVHPSDPRFVHPVDVGITVHTDFIYNFPVERFSHSFGRETALWIERWPPRITRADFFEVPIQIERERAASRIDPRLGREQIDMSRRTPNPRRH